MPWAARGGSYSFSPRGLRERTGGSARFTNIPQTRNDFLGQVHLRVADFTPQQSKAGICCQHCYPARRARLGAWQAQNRSSSHTYEIQDQWNQSLTCITGEVCTEHKLRCRGTRICPLRVCPGEYSAIAPLAQRPSFGSQPARTLSRLRQVSRPASQRGRSIDQPKANCHPARNTRGVY
jgi:hypothetical protein